MNKTAATIASYLRRMGYELNGVVIQDQADGKITVAIDNFTIADVEPNIEAVMKAVMTAQSKHDRFIYSISDWDADSIKEFKDLLAIVRKSHNMAKSILVNTGYTLDSLLEFKINAERFLDDNPFTDF